MLLGEPWVLYRSGGRVRAFVDRCPHRRCPLTLGHCEGGVLQCAYHGWRFDDAGRCVEIPALGEGAMLPPAARLTPAAAVTEAHGIVFLAPEPPIAPLGSIPEADDEAFMEGLLPTLRARGSAGLLADNFLDIAHFPFVHAGTFGTDEAAEVAPFVGRSGRLVVHRGLRAPLRPPRGSRGRGRPASAGADAGASPTGSVRRSTSGSASTSSTPVAPTSSASSFSPRRTRRAGCSRLCGGTTSTATRHA